MTVVSCRQCANFAGDEAGPPCPSRFMLMKNTMRSGSGNGSGFSRTALTTEKIAVLAPIPRANADTAAAVNTAFWRNIRSACLRSCRKSSTESSAVTGMPARTLRHPHIRFGWTSGAGLASLAAKGGRWIEAGGAPRRSIRTQHGHGNEHRGHDGKRRRIVRRHSEQESANIPGQHGRGRESDDDAQRGDRDSLADNQTEDLRRGRAERQSKPDLAGPLIHSVGAHTV